MSDKLLSTKQRASIIDRARGCCEYCRSQARFATQSFSIEHIIPRSKGGRNTVDNLALSCQGCNNHKYNKLQGYDPVSREAVSLFHPRRQCWSTHFTWNDDYTLVIGLSPIGRATVETLQLNRTGLVNMRRVLYAMGEHPPALPATKSQT